MMRSCGGIVGITRNWKRISMSSFPDLLPHRDDRSHLYSGYIQCESAKSSRNVFVVHPPDTHRPDTRLTLKGSSPFRNKGLITELSLYSSTSCRR